MRGGITHGSLLFALTPVSVIAVYAGLPAALFLQMANRPMGRIWGQISCHWLFAASFMAFLVVVIGPTKYASQPIIVWLLALIYAFVVVTVALHLGFLWAKRVVTP